MKKFVVAASLFFSSFASFGAGYQLNLQGLRQLAMGGTGTAWTWDASTIFYNPGGLATMKNIQAYASVLAIMPNTGFSNAIVTANSVQQTFVPFNIYVGGPIREGSPWAVGLGIYTPFGSGLKWDDNWTGRYIIESIKMQSVFIQPTVSYRVGDVLSVGAGFVYANGTVDINQALPVQDLNGSDAQAKLHGNGSGVGVNLGVHFKLGDALQLGLTYRSQISMKVNSGSATFTVPASLSSSFPNTSFATKLPLPQVASFGLAFRPVEDLTVQVDVNYTGWHAYDSLRIDFAQTTSSLQNNHAPRHYRNTVTPRLGFCYKLSHTFSVMAGAAYDPTPVTNGFVSPDLPDADRIVLTCGLSVKPAPRLTILAAFEGVSSVRRAASYNFGNFSGTYQTMAATPGIGLYYNF